MNPATRFQMYRNMKKAMLKMLKNERDQTVKMINEAISNAVM